jgi:hypothetical protein
MKLYELRAVWRETYDCREEGVQDICENHDTIALQIDSDEKLKQMQADLIKGFNNNYWSLKRSKELRSIYPQYDDYKDQKFIIIELTDFII